MLLGIVLTTSLVSIAGLGASVFVKSPQQVAAEAGPPKATVLSAAVERRVVRETVILRGSVAPGRSIRVSPQYTGPGRAIVTRSLMRQGQRVSAGAVVLEVSGRPVFALHGRVPSYRDIQPGDRGPDVKQLQQALRLLGQGIGDSPGVFGSSTQAAVKRLYVARGYEAPTAVRAEDEGPKTAEGGADARSSGARKPGSTGQTSLPAAEVVFVSRFPVRVAKVNARLGDEVKGDALTLATGDLLVRGSLSPVDRKLVKTAMKVTILDEQSGMEMRGVVASIGEFSGGSSSGMSGGEGETPGSTDRDGSTSTAPGHPIVVKGIRPLPEAFAGHDVRLTIEAASTDGPVLVVPSSAVYASADGSIQLIKLGPDQRQRRVQVTTGATGGGYVEIRSADIAEGDQVVVGK